MNYGRLDNNQRKIVKLLRQHCVSVQSLASVGYGCPDIMVGFQGHDWKFEIKNPEQPPSKRILTKHEKIWRRDWRGSKPHTVLTLDEIVEIIGCIV